MAGASAAGASAASAGALSAAGASALSAGASDAGVSVTSMETRGGVAGVRQPALGVGRRGCRFDYANPEYR